MGEGNKRARHEEAQATPSHRVLTSDELGLLKATEVPHGSHWEGTAAKQRWGHPDKQQGISRMQIYCPDRDLDRCLVAAARCSGRVTVHSPSDFGLELGSFRGAPPPSTSGRTDTSSNEFRGLRFSEVEGQHQLVLVTGTAGGHVSVHRCPGPAAALQAQAAAGTVQTWETAQRLQTIGDLQAMDVSTSGRHVAVGGEGHQLKVWDLAAAAAGGAGGGAAACEPLFAGRAGKPSRSGLQDLAHVTAVVYVPGGGDQQILVGTAKHKLWLYDMRAGRKPQSELVWSDGRITALLPTPDGRRVWVGNGKGQIEALDLRQAPAKMEMRHALKGSAGSVRALRLHPTEPLIASVSLDRHLRIHSTTTRSLLTKVYLKQALTGVAWLPVLVPASAAPVAAAEGGRTAEEGARNGGNTSEHSRQRQHKSKSQKRQKRDKAAKGGGEGEDE